MRFALIWLLSTVFSVVGLAESTCVPLNASVFRVREPSGAERFFIRDPDEPNLIFSGRSWRGFIRPERSMINVETIPDSGWGHIEYCFVGGHLRFMTEGDKDTEITLPSPAPATNPQTSDSSGGSDEKDIKTLWPAATLTLAEKIDSDIWKGAGRFRPLSGNPNRDAAVFGCLTMVAFGLVLVRRGWTIRILGLLLTLPLAYLTLLTKSRGGIAGLGLGFVVMMFMHLRKKLNMKLVVLVLALCAGTVGTLAAMGTFGDRFSPERVMSELEHGDRLPIWREVPRMVAAAPLGWGLWRSGPAYNDWFEVQTKNYTTGDLFNDHFSRFVEGGWLLGGLYVLIWMVAFFLFGRLALRGGTSAPLGVASAFLLAVSCNPVVYWAPSLYVPISMFGVFALTRPWREAKGYLKALAGACGMTLLVLGGIGIVVARAPKSDIPMHVSWLGRQIVLGGETAEVWAAGRTDAVLDGDYYGFLGKAIRRFYQKNPQAEPIGLVESVADLPKSMRTLVLAGKTGAEFLAMPKESRPVAELLIFLSPPFGYGHIDKGTLSSAEVHCVVGEFAAAALGLSGDVPEWVHVVPGAELYIPGWLQSVVRMKGEGGETHED